MISNVNQIKRIVFLLNTTLDKRDYDRFGVDIFKEDFDILFIDFQKLFYPLLTKETDIENKF